MSDKRAGLFEEELDISGFAPKPPARPEQVKAVAEEAGFRSRGPSPARVPASPPTPPEAPAGRREQRRYRTGRNQQLNLKVRAEDAATFYAIADAQGWVLGDAFARAIAALTRELQARKR
ncbi:stability/partitioning determinant [Roseicella frigidaeris]|uniref:Stability/partitioning determinant n=1 Tax=Roseicella frigidaeris TaxID=2230885 RepID=A0A327LXQ5_9PROT|nr:stability/partitioning determinant [Roseicella frigidaeris]RAI54662.1 stability/partitioning determinant [Roseicella frigidaeris]